MAEHTLEERRRTGWIVIAILAALTVIEYMFAILLSGSGQLAAISAVALVKAAVIVDYFMHFSQLWGHINSLWNAVVFGEDEETEEEAAE